MSNVDLMNESEAQWFKRQIVEAKAEGYREAINAAARIADLGGHHVTARFIRELLPPAERVDPWREAAEAVAKLVAARNDPYETQQELADAIRALLPPAPSEGGEPGKVGG